MVLQLAPLVGIEVVDEFDQFRIVEAVVSEQLPDIAPVFLFDMGIVVFLVGSGSGELDSWLMVGEVPQQVMVEELGAVVTIESFEFKGEVGLDIFDLCYDSGGAVVPCCSTFGPAGVDIGESQTPDEVTGQRVTAMGDRVGLDEAGLRDIPVVSADGDLIAQ